MNNKKKLGLTIFLVLGLGILFSSIILTNSQTISDIILEPSQILEADYEDTTSSATSEISAIVSSYFLSDTKFLEFGGVNIYEKTITESVQNFEMFLVPSDEVVDFSNLNYNSVFETSEEISLRDSSLHTFETLNFSYYVSGSDDQELKLMDTYYPLGTSGEEVKIYSDSGTLIFQVNDGILRGFSGIGLYEELMYPEINGYFTSLLGEQPLEIYTAKFNLVEPSLEGRRIFIAKNEVFVGWLIDLNNDGLMDFEKTIPILTSLGHEGNSLLFCEPNKLYDLWLEI